MWCEQGCRQNQGHQKKNLEYLCYTFRDLMSQYNNIQVPKFWFFAPTLCMIHFNKDFQLELLPGWVCDPDPGAPGSIQVIFRWFSGGFQDHLIRWFLVVLRPQVVFTWHSGDPHPPSWRLSRPLRPRCHNCTHRQPDQTYLQEQSEFWIPKIRTRQDRKTTEGNEESFDEDQNS